ncbi:MAG: hypothetical protein HY023_07445 [Chloroflexi bacterium]|nr:hypothetical protein [Chloroflexota bacterium]
MTPSSFWRNFSIGAPAIRRGDGGTIAYWPLRGPDAKPKVGFVDDVVLDQDMSYTRLKFRTRFTGPTVIPAGFTLFMDGAQDRTVYAAHVFDKETVVAAHCVEPGEGGLWNAKKTMRVGMLPLALRVPSFRSRHRDEAGAIWGSIRVLLQASGIRRHNGSLRALIEAPHIRSGVPGLTAPDTLPDQRGVVVTLNGAVVGVEIAPSAAQFRAWWTRGGLNESYATEVARLFKPPALAASSGETLADHLFAAALRLRPTNGPVLDLELGGLVGQAVMLGDEVTYASAVGERL